MKYRKKPVVIDAIQWVGGDYSCLDSFCGRNWTRADVVGYDQPTDEEAAVVYNTAEKAWLHLPVGHFLIRGINAELYPCAADIFEKTYEPVTE